LSTFIYSCITIKFTGMKKFHSAITVLFFLIILSFTAKSQYSHEYELNIYTENNDGPYLIYKGNKVEIITVKFINDKPRLKIDSCTIKELAGKKIKVKPNIKMPSFSVKVFDYQPELSFYKAPEKLLVISDIEGNFEDFTKILRVAGVINKKYEWVYGKNHLLINGDLFDRGDDVTALLWLCYKLDNESQLLGGKVHIKLGNHDQMNMEGDIRYIDSKYLKLDSLLGIEHKNLYNENTEIGRWLRTKNAITIIDSTLFVHGGISPDLINLNLNPQQINQIIRENLGKDDSQMDKISKFLFGHGGPFWYRGLIMNFEKYKPVTPENLNYILLYFGVKNLVVGHCIVPEIIGLHEGKVIAVDVNHPLNRKEKKSRALLITNKKFYAVYDNGKIKDLPIKKGFVSDIEDKKY